jgi:hypothetical protein
VHVFGETNDGQLDSDDGSEPHGSLILHDGLLYGTCYDGGDTSAADPPGDGTVFELNPFATNPGSTYQQIYSFSGPTGDGQNPLDNVLFVNNIMYGLTKFGGANGSAPEDRTLFSLGGVVSQVTTQPLSYVFNAASDSIIGSFLVRYNGPTTLNGIFSMSIPPVSGVTVLTESSYVGMLSSGQSMVLTVSFTPASAPYLGLLKLKPLPLAEIPIEPED